MKTDEQAETKNGHLQTNSSRPQNETAAPDPHPLAGVIGGFADDPLWDEFVEQMKQGRCELAQSEEESK